MTDLRSADLPDVRDDDHVRGGSDAPLAVVYADFTCPRCALAHERLTIAGTRVVFRHFALKSRHPRAEATALAAEAVARQDAFWPFADALYGDQGRLDDPHLWERISKLGLDLDRFEADRRAPETLERVKRDVHDGMRAGVTTTPTLFVNGEMHPGVPDEPLLQRLRYSGPVPT